MVKPISSERTWQRHRDDPSDAAAIGGVCWHDHDPDDVLLRAPTPRPSTRHPGVDQDADAARPPSSAMQKVLQQLCEAISHHESS